MAETGFLLVMTVVSVLLTSLVDNYSLHPTLSEKLEIASLEFMQNEATMSFKFI